MKLTDNFTYEEMIYSETAIRLGYDNTPDEQSKSNLIILCEKVLEPLRKELNVPIKINSGFRAGIINSSVGGSFTSQHCKGQAADTVAIGISIKNYYDKIKELVKNNKLDVDQVILEYNSWVHISYNKDNNRKQFMVKEKGKSYVMDIDFLN